MSALVDAFRSIDVTCTQHAVLQTRNGTDRDGARQKT